MNKILIVEDDNDINKLISEMLEEKNYEIKSAYSGTEALMYLKNENIDMVILDLMLPGKCGEEVLKEIRILKSIPIIVISAKNDKNTKIELLKRGADDFISKPFDIDEVEARVYAQMRRYKTFKEDSFSASEENILKYKEILLNIDNMEVYINNKIINLTTREFEILKLLMEYPKKVFSKSNIFESVWNEEFLGDDNTINVHMSNLRSKLNTSNNKYKYIQTIWGIGYKLDT
ncbi:response regulator transcription factor [Clostridium ihumii]|uniref:response regulator transcription factor n=1 Tax=Clostridium ihumii TaxID=1470356 RepID=UPI00058B1634|nr:response regulator transcription factor [Clostridium ihumii]